MHRLVLQHRDVTDFGDALVHLAEAHMSEHAGARTRCTLYFRSARGSHFVAASDPDLAALARHHGWLPEEQHPTADRRSEARNSFSTAARALSVRSLMTVPLDLEDDGVAALSFYGTDEGTFSAGRRRRAEDFARSAARSLHLVLRLGSTTQREANLRAALESRTVIDLAVGMIMAQNRCSHQQAVSILRRASNTQGTRLRAIAERIVSTYDPQQPVTHFTN
ncbi:ANTAR domain-containing protein [Arthrobacter sp. TMS1-12-1]